MSMSERAVVAMLALIFASTGCALLPSASMPAKTDPTASHPSPRLGKPLTARETGLPYPIVFPDGQGLPPGRGTVAQGARLYQDRCARCHGADGRGATAQELVGGMHPLSDGEADRSIGAYWPNATTLFDFIRRAMPLDAPGSVTPDEAYAYTAYLLHRNDLLGPNEEIDQTTLPLVDMPNRNGFVPIDAFP